MKKLMIFAVAVAMAGSFAACVNSTKGNVESTDSAVVENDSAAMAVSLPISEGDSIGTNGAEAAASANGCQGRGKCRHCSCTQFVQRPGYYQCWCGHQSFVHD